MIYNLTKTEDFLFVLDNSEIKEGVWYFLPRTQSPHFCGSKESEEELNLERDFGVRKILAHIPINRPKQTLYGLPTLPTLPTLLEKHEDSIDDMAREFYWKRNPDKDFAENSRPDMVIGFVGGYNKAREKFKFTEEEYNILFSFVEKLYHEGYDPYDSAHHIQLQRYVNDAKQIINISLKRDLKLPIAFECETERKSVMNLGLDVFNPNRRVFLNEPKTIINSEGKQEWVGKYIYE
jgi:hypothetical protein